VPIEAGHAGENRYLQAESLRLATVSIDACFDQRVHEIVGEPTNQRPPVRLSRRSPQMTDIVSRVLPG
jgi:hypothetical protein